MLMSFEIKQYQAGKGYAGSQAQRGIRLKRKMVNHLKDRCF